MYRRLRALWAARTLHLTVLAADEIPWPRVTSQDMRLAPKALPSRPLPTTPSPGDGNRKRPTRLGLRHGPLALGLLLLGFSAATQAEFTNRYPRVTGYAHQIYLEGYELPGLNVGPSDAAMRPDGRAVAVTAYGHLWLQPLNESLQPSGPATQLTFGRPLFSRPAWAPDGKTLALQQDTGADTQLALLDVASRQLRVVLDTPTLDLDPAFAADGRSLFYSSGEAGDLDLWRLDLATGRRERLTQATGLELRPLPLPDGRHVVYLTKSRTTDTVSLLDLRDGSSRVLLRDLIVSQLRPALSTDGKKLALNLPDAASLSDTHRLWLYDLDAEHATLSVPVTLPLLPQPVQGIDPSQSGIPLVTSLQPALRPLMPTFSPRGDAVLFTAPDSQHRFQLWRAPVTGAPPTQVLSALGTPAASPSAPGMAMLTVETQLAGQPGLVPTRLHLEDQHGHPLLGEDGIARLDGQSGLSYVYSGGSYSLRVPAGTVRVMAAHGLLSPVQEAALELKPGEQRTIRLTLTPLWDAGAAGYLTGDHHFHLNYGGPYQVRPEELAQLMRAEQLDLATPLVANLGNRLQDLALWQQFGVGPKLITDGQTAGPQPLVAFGHEVRSHFLGHLGLISIPTPAWPWFWGPGYPVQAGLDIPNSDLLQWTRQSGGIGSYVHPVVAPKPLSAEAPATAIPLMLVPDAVLGDLDTLEVACLWSDEQATSEVWHQLLNLGLPVALSAGTDAMVNLTRNMAVGTTRLYVYSEANAALMQRLPYEAFSTYLAALKAGQSFVSTGPILDLRVAGQRPGQVIRTPGSTVDWTLTVASTVPLSRIELLVNGEVVQTLPVPSQFPARQELQGRLTLPSGGWVAARAVGKLTQWPAMDSYPFAHTSPIWLGTQGSTDPDKRRIAAQLLLRALGHSEARLREAFPPPSPPGAQPDPVPRLRQRLVAARARLLELSR